MADNINLALSSIREAIGRQIVTDAWVADEDTRASNVKTYREYLDGEHDFSWLSSEQRTALNLRPGKEFVVNHCGNILGTFSDRLSVSSIEGETDAASEWIASVLEFNNFAELQLGIHESAPGDGESYLMVSFDNEEKKPVLSHELAFDGMDGMLVVYKRGGSDELLCALKLWNEVVDAQTIRTRLNVYFEDRVEKLASLNGGKFTWYYEDGENPVDDAGRLYLPWLLPNGEPIGVPVIPFKHDARGKGSHGISLIENVTPLQNAMNRSLHSLIASEELSAFQVRYIMGMSAPAKVAPGMFLEFVPKDASGNVTRPDAATAEWLKAIRIGAIEQGDLQPHIETLRYIRGQMYEVSGTPDYEAAADASGESLKQREIRLLARVEKHQVKFGSAWQRVAKMAARVGDAFAVNKPPASKFWRAHWKEAQLRNDVEVVDNAMKMEGVLPVRALLRLVAPVFNWDETTIEKIVLEKEEEAARRLATMTNVPAFGGGNDDDDSDEDGGTP